MPREKGAPGAPAARRAKEATLVDPLMIKDSRLPSPAAAHEDNAVVPRGHLQLVGGTLFIELHIPKLHRGEGVRGALNAVELPRNDLHVAAACGHDSHTRGT
eukprot:1196269-Prorocentrum_minimum.AAC.11